MSFDNKIGEGKYVISVDNSGAISQLQQFDNKVKQSSQNTQTSFRQAAASAVSLASGLGSLYFQYDNLEKVQLRIKRASLEVSRAQEEVNKLTSQGKTDTLDYQQALERLAIAEEKHKILSNDLTQSQIALSLSFAQTALSLPAAINGIKGLTSASSVLSAVTSKWTIIALAAIAAYEGIAQAIKITTGADYTLTTATGKLMDSMMGSNKIISEGTAEFKAYGNTISDVGIKASDTASSFVDLNKEMDRTIDKLKKNEISDRLSQVKAQMSDSMLFMGSLEYLVNTFKSAGVEGFVGEIAKDTRTIDNINKVKSAVISLYSVIGGRAIPTDALGPNIVKASDFGILRIGPYRLTENTIASSRIQDVFKTTFSRANRGGTSFLGGQADALKSEFSKLGGIKMSGVNSRNLTSGLKTIRKGAKHGGHKRGWGVAEVAKPFNAATAGFQATADYYKSLGFDISVPSFNLQSMVGSYRSPSNEFLQTSIRQATASYDSQVARFNEQIAQAKATIENRILSLASRSGLSRSEVVALQTTQQGTDDLYGIIDYRERLARASTGTG